MLLRIELLVFFLLFLGSGTVMILTSQKAYSFFTKSHKVEAGVASAVLAVIFGIITFILMMVIVNTVIAIAGG